MTQAKTSSSQHPKQWPPEKRRWRAFPLPIAECVEQVTRPVFKTRGFSEMRLIRDWPSIVGPELAACVSPVKVTFPPAKRSGGTLTLITESGAALALQYRIPHMLEIINSYFGHSTIARIRVEQTHIMTASDTYRIPKLKPSSTRPNPEEDTLESALLRLSEQITKRA